MRARTKGVKLTKTDEARINDVTKGLKNVPNTVRINDVTKGLTPSYSNRLSELSTKQISTICDYISALRSEIILSNGYRRNILNTLIALSRIKSKKEFKDFTRADVIEFMKFRKDSEKRTLKILHVNGLALIIQIDSCH